MGGVEGEREEERGGKNRITTAHRCWLGWRCQADCRIILACLKINKERNVVEGGVR